MAGERNRWWLLLCWAIAAAVLFFAIIVTKAFDLALIVYTFVAVPLISLAWVIVLLATSAAKRRTPKRAYFLMIPIYWAVTGLLFVNNGAIRLHTRWLLHGNDLKARIDSQPGPSNGELKHTEFDGWGWVGMGTEEYPVFDPTDSMTSPNAVRSGSKFPGIPCTVSKLRRMESPWYVVTYYTGSVWDQCT